MPHQVFLLLFSTDVVFVVDSGRVKENQRDEIKEAPSLVECWVSRGTTQPFTARRQDAYLTNFLFSAEMAFIHCRNLLFYLYSHRLSLISYSSNNRSECEATARPRWSCSARYCLPSFFKVREPGGTMDHNAASIKTSHAPSPSYVPML